jgi:hypothetical protein
MQPVTRRWEDSHFSEALCIENILQTVDNFQPNTDIMNQYSHEIFRKILSYWNTYFGTLILKR